MLRRISTYVLAGALLARPALAFVDGPGYEPGEYHEYTIEGIVFGAIALFLLYWLFAPRER